MTATTGLRGPASIGGKLLIRPANNVTAAVATRKLHKAAGSPTFKLPEKISALNDKQ